MMIVFIEYASGLINPMSYICFLIFFLINTTNLGAITSFKLKYNICCYPVAQIGDQMDRGCEETCECNPGGTFECSPRCKVPFIRRGKPLDDPLCFESPVDECCSIIACATENSGNNSNL